MAKSNKPKVKRERVGESYLYVIVGTPKSSKLVRASMLVPLSAAREDHMQILTDFLVQHIPDWATKVRN